MAISEFQIVTSSQQCLEPHYLPNWGNVVPPYCDIAATRPRVRSVSASCPWIRGADLGCYVFPLPHLQLASEAVENKTKIK